MLIGVASALMLLSGRITGISGIVGGLLIPKSSDAPWRAVFIVAMLAGMAFYRLLFEQPISGIGEMGASGPGSFIARDGRS